VFYISPYTKFDPRPEKREIYFKLKEIMLHRGIGFQAIEREKIFGKFDYSIANIGIAMIAKMGGIPWRLSRPAEKELIIGFGAFKSQRYNTKYVGSAFCFSNEGIFQEFNCFPADETWSIAGSAEEALLAYRRNNPDVKRMVIHYYKTIGYKEIKPVEDMLRKLKLDIPIIVVRINKTFSESQLIFDDSFSGKMPLHGSYVHIGRNEYLFCNNHRENAGSDVSKITLPLPLKIGLQSNHPGLLDDPALIERLMMQVYEFSFMHWRSVSQSTLPVTVTYPEMLAKLFPWFDSDTLPDEGRRSLFFL
jgi:argonaute-like protein implicated in RNA metabolism and viral defense